MPTFYRFAVPIVVVEIHLVEAESEEQALTKINESTYCATEACGWSPEQWIKEFGQLTGDPILVDPINVSQSELDQALKRAHDLWGSELD